MNDLDLEELLQLIARAAPKAWHPRAYAEASGIPLEAVHAQLEHLYLEGLVEKGQNDPDDGPGVVLTPLGAEVLRDPDALERLRQGKAIDPQSHGAGVREVLRRPHRPIVSWLLMLANLAFFGYSVYLASLDRFAGKFLASFIQLDPQLLPILWKSGGLDGTLLIRGDWWRLLTTCFVHLGALQLIFDLWMLFGTCRRTERWWGWERTLAVFLVAGFCSNCVQLARSVGLEQQGQVFAMPIIGGWGAICGLIGAEAVWMLLSRKHLPQSTVRDWRRGFIATAVLLVFMSLFPGSGGWGLLGGAVAGAVAGLFLYWQRFGPDPWRWLGFLAVVPLPWVGYGLVDRARQTDPVWKKLEKKEQQREEKEFEASKLPNRLGKAVRMAREWYDIQFAPMLRRDGDNWKARDPAEVKKVVANLEDLWKQIDHVQNELRQARRTYRNPEILGEVNRAEVYLKAWAKPLKLAEQYLRDREEITREDRNQLKQQRDEVEKVRRELE